VGKVIELNRKEELYDT